MTTSQDKSTSFVLFGALGDLSLRKLMPARYYLERSGLLDDSLRILGVARPDITREQFQKKIIDALNLYVPGEYLDDDVCNKLIERINYCCCDLKNHDDYRKLEQSLNDWSKPISYYLAIPPDLFEVVWFLLFFQEVYYFFFLLILNHIYLL